MAIIHSSCLPRLHYFVSNKDVSFLDRVLFVQTVGEADVDFLFDKQRQYARITWSAAKAILVKRSGSGYEAYDAPFDSPAALMPLFEHLQGDLRYRFFFISYIYITYLSLKSLHDPLQDIPIRLDLELTETFIVGSRLEVFLQCFLQLDAGFLSNFVKVVRGGA